MIGWNFPSNGGGAINGVADSGIQIFKGKEIASLAREICQNSLDAAINENSAVTVEFCCYKINTKDIPGYKEYIKFLTACQNFWKGNKEASAFIKTALERMNFLYTDVLRVSDFNTTGLAEPFNLRSMQGWNTLTKINGGATKSDDKAGSFGIGKNAPFANSFFRMIFYRTLNLKGERAAQAVAKLVSFNLDMFQIATGTGYYGEMRGNMPLKNIPELDNLCQRTRAGTDVFVYGFNCEKTCGENIWSKEIVRELIENFLVAIHRDKLRVKVQDFNIGKNNLSDILSKYADTFNNAANYYKILTGDAAVKTYERKFHGMGKLKLGILLDPTAKLNRKVLIVRKSGMKLFELDRFSRTLNFTAILELEGHDLNAFFRQMETPDHTNWESTRHEKNRALAKKYLDELKRWVRDTITGLGEANISDETDVRGLDHMLDFNHGAIDDGKILQPTIGNRNKTMTLSMAPVESSKRKNLKPSKPSTDDKRIFCDKIRVIKVSGRRYRLILKSPRNVLGGRIEIYAMGESIIGEKLFISQATSADLNSQVFAYVNRIIFQDLRGNTDARINFELQDDNNYALGVSVYED